MVVPASCFLLNQWMKEPGLIREEERREIADGAAKGFRGICFGVTGLGTDAGTVWGQLRPRCPRDQGLKQFVFKDLQVPLGSGHEGTQVTAGTMGTFRGLYLPA